MSRTGGDGALCGAVRGSSASPDGGFLERLDGTPRATAAHKADPGRHTALQRDSPSRPPDDMGGALRLLPRSRAETRMQTPPRRPPPTLHAVPRPPAAPSTKQVLPAGEKAAPQTHGSCETETETESPAVLS